MAKKGIGEQQPLSAYQKTDSPQTPSTPYESSQNVEDFEDDIGVLELQAEKPSRFKRIMKTLFSFLYYPRVIWLILGCELCERFAFYGAKTILYSYLRSMDISEDHSTMIVHGFIFFAYLTPLLGGTMADSRIGKYWTIFGLSIVYCFGQLFISMTAIKPQIWGVLVGLFFVGIGTGGIKPCVSSFGGDQFNRKTQADLLTSFFNLFYFSVNTGSTVSTIVTPAIRTNVNYWVAFLVPAILLFIATGIFSVGKPWYKVIKSKEIIMFKVIGCVVYALYRQVVYRFKQITSCIRRTPLPPAKKHWLHRAASKYPNQFIKDVKKIMSITVILLPIMFFWSLYDQHSSRWIESASKMNRKFGKIEIDADQVQVLNPVTILLMVPLFDRIVYPIIRVTPFNFSPLRRIGIGFLFTALSFLCCVAVEIAIDSSPHETVHVIFQVPQFLLLGAGEILVSITGLEFAYSEAPESMRSIMSSIYLVVIAFGNLIVLITAAIPILPDGMKYKGAIEFGFFSLLILVALFVFVLISLRYKYDNPESETSKENKQEQDKEDDQDMETEQDLQTEDIDGIE